MSGRQAVVLSALFFLAAAAFLLLSGVLRSKGAAEIRRLLGPLRGGDLNILLFTLDTTRADHLGCYGDMQAETPNIDRIAGEGFLFRHAISQAPLTLPSHSSIFTGTEPCFHGVRDNGGFYLDPGATTLAEVLKKGGWATSAFIGAYVLDSRWGIGQGFDEYFDHFDFSKYKTVSFDTVQRKGEEVVQAFFNWFDKNHSSKFFSWIHLYDPHTPYEPPEPFRSRHGNRPWGLYDGEIAYVDSLIGRVVARLESEGLMDKTILIIAADHGESLGEHNESGHGFFVYDATQAVPLIVRFPRPPSQAGTIETPVENIDIMPSLLELVGLPAPREVQGRSFLDLLAGKPRGPERLAYSETFYPRYRYGWSELKSLRSAGYKYIKAPRPEFYDLVRDPHEELNIYDPGSREAARLERALRDLEGRRAAKGVEERGPRNLDGEAREKLMALGYVGAFTSSSKLARSGGLGDPKDKIFLYNKIKLAEGASINREFDESLKLLDEALAEDPGIMEARQIKASIYLQLDRPEEAIVECREALKIDEDYEAAIFIMAQAYRSLRKFDEAAAGYNRVIQLNPKNPEAYGNLGETYYVSRDLDKAIPALRKAIELDPEHSAKAHNVLGLAYLEKKMPDLAVEEIGIALRIRPNIPDAHYNLGTIYESAGDLENAIREYKKEIAIHPEAHPAYFNLALIYGKQGKLREEAGNLRLAVKADPKFARGYLFLAKTCLDLNENLEEAVGLAEKGLELDPEAESAPLGHYVLADIYNRLGRRSESLIELERGRTLERKLKAVKAEMPKKQTAPGLWPR